MRRNARWRERRKHEAEEASEYERERDRAQCARGKLPEQREHHHRRPARAKDRGGDAQVSQLRQEIAQRNQRQAAAASVRSRHEIRSGPGRYAERGERRGSQWLSPRRKEVITR